MRDGGFLASPGARPARLLFGGLHPGARRKLPAARVQSVFGAWGQGEGAPSGGGTPADQGPRLSSV